MIRECIAVRLVKTLRVCLPIVASTLFVLASSGAAPAQEDTSCPPALIPLRKYEPLKPIEFVHKPVIAGSKVARVTLKDSSPLENAIPDLSPSGTAAYGHPVLYETAHETLERELTASRASVRTEKERFAELDHQIRLHPDRSEFYHLRGKLRIQAGHRCSEETLVAAYADFSEAISRDPGRADSLFARGWVASQLGDPAAALADLSGGLARVPDDPSARTLRGVIYAERQDYEQAMVDFDRAIAADATFERSFELLTSRADCFAARGNYRRAVEDLETAIETHTFDPYLYLKRARFYGILGERMRAIADIDELIQIRPDDMTFRSAINLTLVQIGEYVRASGDASRLQVKHPDHPAPYLLRFVASYIAVRQRDKILRDVERFASSAESLLPTRQVPFAIRATSLALRGLGRERALKDMERGLDLIPDMSLPHACGAVVNASEGRLIPTCRDLLIFVARFNPRRYNLAIHISWERRGVYIELQEGHPGIKKPDEAGKLDATAVRHLSGEIMLDALASRFASPR